MNQEQHIRIGYVFSTSNRRLNKSWQAPFRRTCLEIEQEGHTIKEIWNDPETEIRMAPAECPLSAAIGRKSSPATQAILIAFQQAHSATPAMRLGNLGELFRRLDFDERNAIARLAAATGTVVALEKLVEDREFELLTPDGLGMTPLGWACAFGHANIIEWAIRQKISLVDISHFSWNYCDLAYANGKGTVHQMLLDAGVTGHGQTLHREMAERGVAFKTP